MEVHLKDTGSRSVRVLITAAAPHLSQLPRQLIEAAAENLDLPVPDLSTRWPIDIQQAVHDYVTCSAFGDTSLVTAPGSDYETLGGLVCQVGVPLEVLQDSVRMACRLALAQVIRAVNLTLSSLTGDETVSLVESIERFGDAILTAVANGYQLELAGGSRDVRAKQRILGSHLLRGSDASEISEAAEAVGWNPDELVAAVLTTPTDAEQLAAMSTDRIGYAHRDIEVVIAVPIHPSRAATSLRESYADLDCVVGPAVTRENFLESLRLATATRELHLPRRERPRFAEDYLVNLLCATDPAIVEVLRRRHLGPLDELPTGQRAVMEETLRSWLMHWGHRPSVAEAMDVHPQTVSGRINKLRDLLGDSLDDPKTLFEIQVALTPRDT